MRAARDHGGGLDGAIAQFGGVRSDWIDLSTGINPIPYPLPDLPADAWTALPDAGAQEALIAAARAFWAVPEGAGIMAANGVSQIIALLPYLAPKARIAIASRSYNEFRAAFDLAGWDITDDPKEAGARIIVHPNNPDGALADPDTIPTDDSYLILDESFCDLMPDASLMALATRPNTLILKGLGKFWGLAGLRLGFAIGDPNLVRWLCELAGPWPVSGPAQAIGTTALRDQRWADATRARLAQDAARLDALATAAGLNAIGGCDLYRLYGAVAAQDIQFQLAQQNIWSRIFPYDNTWIRIGLPGPSAHWDRLEAAFKRLT